jgi:uncharacterized protein
VEEREMIRKLMKEVEGYLDRGVCIAFSGGVDSSLLLKVACMSAKEHGVEVPYAVTFETRLHPHSDTEEAKETAKEFGARHAVIQIDEFQDERIRKNPVDRCYLCKKLLFTDLKEFAGKAHCQVLMDGSNYDDTKVYRPGMRALKEMGVISPLMDLRLTKQQVRNMALALGIKASSKPSTPCMATRLPYGTEFDYELLDRIHQAETFIRGLGFYNVRLRLHGQIGRIEIDKERFAEFLDRREEVIARLKELGFIYITLDLQGFRSGSMDILIEKDGAREQ